MRRRCRCRRSRRGSYPKKLRRISRSPAPTVQLPSISAMQSPQSSHGPHEASKISRSLAPTDPSPSESADSLREPPPRHRAS